MVCELTKVRPIVPENSFLLKNSFWAEAAQPRATAQTTSQGKRWVNISPPKSEMTWFSTSVARIYAVDGRHEGTRLDPPYKRADATIKMVFYPHRSLPMPQD